MPTTFEKLSTATLRGRIAEKIQRAILTGSLREGERLVERKLAAQFETSLTAVREALVQLESEGFVTKRPNASTHVTKLSPHSAKKIFAVRRVLETYAIEEAARLATPEQIQELEESYFEMLDTARSKEPQLFILKDLELHEKIWRISDNEYLEATLRRIVHPIAAFSAIRSISCLPFDILRDATSHLPTVEAIKSGNPEAARKAFLEALDEWDSTVQTDIFGKLGGC